MMNDMMGSGMMWGMGLAGIVGIIPQQNACVEVKSTDASAVRISDSKFTGSARPEFAASPEAFAAFTAFARS